METDSPELPLPQSPNQPTAIVCPASLVERWTDGANPQHMGNIGKITAHKVHRHNRIRQAGVDYKVSSFAYNTG